MAYEKQEWNCGDTITADKMNHIEEGIENAQSGYECTSSEVTLASSETISTSEEDTFLSYTNLIDADTLVVYFDGTRYECPKISGGSAYNAYGGYSSSEEATDFSEYPFAIRSAIETEVPTRRNIVYTQTVGTHTIELKTISEVINTTECFEKAVESVVKGGKAFTDVGGGTCGNNTYVEYNITYNDFINARNNGTNIVYALTDANELQAGNIVAFDCIERSGWYEVQAIYAQVSAGTPFPTVDWMPLALFCDTADGYMRSVNCWGGVQ